jgi:hypothetical protein
MVKSTIGLHCNSVARCKAYSFNWRPLGGKVETRQIFIALLISE